MKPHWVGDTWKGLDEVSEPHGYLVEENYRQREQAVQKPHGSGLFEEPLQG